MKSNNVRQSNGAQKQEQKVLHFLYEVYYDLFNRDNVPASTRLIAQDLKLDKKRVLDILRNLQQSKEVELITMDRSYSFARITPRGLRRIETVAG